MDLYGIEIALLDPGTVERPESCQALMEGAEEEAEQEVREDMVHDRDLCKKLGVDFDKVPESLGTTEDGVQYYDGPLTIEAEAGREAVKEGGPGRRKIGGHVSKSEKSAHRK